MSFRSRFLCLLLTNERHAVAVCEVIFHQRLCIDASIFVTCALRSQYRLVYLKAVKHFRSRRALTLRKASVSVRIARDRVQRLIGGGENREDSDPQDSERRHAARGAEHAEAVELRKNSVSIKDANFRRQQEYRSKPVPGEKSNPREALMIAAASAGYFNGSIRWWHLHARSECVHFQAMAGTRCSRACTSCRAASCAGKLDAAIGTLQGCRR